MTILTLFYGVREAYEDRNVIRSTWRDLNSHGANRTVVESDGMFRLVLERPLQPGDYRVPRTNRRLIRPDLQYASRRTTRKLRWREKFDTSTAALINLRSGVSGRLSLGPWSVLESRFGLWFLRGCNVENRASTLNKQCASHFKTQRPEFMRREG
jgi:hypothetical protein